MDPIAVGVIAELIASAVTAAAGKSWKKLKSSPEATMLKIAIDEALIEAFRDAFRGTGPPADDWIAAVARDWVPAFTAEVQQALVAHLTNVDDGASKFAALAVRALQDTGCDLTELERTFWIEQFLAVLPRLLFDQLQRAALSSDSAVRDLVGQLLDQRAEARAAGAHVPVATPRQFREDVITFLHQLDKEARTGWLPPYLPRDADVSELTRTVRVRYGLRSGVRSEGDPGAAGSHIYQLPVERVPDSEPPRPWPAVMTENRRLIVLADPGLGKSWLIRNETHRLCQQALAAARDGDEVGALLIPVPMRCDQLVAADGQTLAEAATGHLATQGLIPPRSRSALRARMNGAGIVLLLDALDELSTEEQYRRLEELLRPWLRQADTEARAVLTSRIAGYRGSPLRDACEVELQAFTPEEVTAAISAWRLPPLVAARVLARAKDPAISAMMRVPLLLALLCSLATELPEERQLPATRGELYERVLRWFLTRAHRADERPELRAEEVDALLEILAPVAFHFATTPTGWTDLMPSGQLLAAIRSVGPAFTELNRPASDVVQDLSTGSGILVPAGNPSAGRSPSYLFLHRTFAEYLVARHLATLPAADWLDVVYEHLWFDSDWAEVIPLLGGQLDLTGVRQLAVGLLHQADDPFRHALLTAVRTIGERPDPAQVLPAGELQSVADTLLCLIDHPATQLTAAHRLAATPRLPRQIFDGLLDRFRAHRAGVRWAAVVALADREDPAVTDGLLERLSDPDSDIRWAAVRALASREGQRVTDELLERLSDSDPDVQWAAIDALTYREGPEIKDRLLNCLDDPELEEAAVAVLAFRQGQQVTDGLLNRLGDPDPEVREGAVVALGSREGPQVTDGLLNRLGDPDSEVRAAAADELAEREGTDVTEGLLNRLGDPDSEVRAAATNALAEREGAEVTDQLLNRLRDPDAWVQEAVFEALKCRGTPMTGQEIVKPVKVVDLTKALKAAVSAARGETTAAPDELPDRPRDLDLKLAQAALADEFASLRIDELLDHLNDSDPDVRRTALHTLTERDAPSDLLALVRHVRRLDSTALQSAYEIAERMVTRAYARLPEESQSEIRVSLAWLTTAVLQSEVL